MPSVVSVSFVLVCLAGILAMAACTTTLGHHTPYGGLWGRVHYHASSHRRARPYEVGPARRRAYNHTRGHATAYSRTHAESHNHSGTTDRDAHSVKQPY